MRLQIFFSQGLFFLNSLWENDEKMLTDADIKFLSCEKYFDSI